jgi:hypothetical protein
VLGAYGERRFYGGGNLSEDQKNGLGETPKEERADPYHQFVRNLPRCPAPKKRYGNDCRQRKDENKYCRAMLLGHEEVLERALRAAKVPA